MGGQERATPGRLRGWLSPCPRLPAAGLRAPAARPRAALTRAEPRASCPPAPAQQERVAPGGTGSSFARPPASPAPLGAATGARHVPGVEGTDDPGQVGTRFPLLEGHWGPGPGASVGLLPLDLQRPLTPLSPRPGTGPWPPPPDTQRGDWSGPLGKRNPPQPFKQQRLECGGVCCGENWDAPGGDGELSRLQGTLHGRGGPVSLLLPPPPPEPLTATQGSGQQRSARRCRAPRGGAGLRAKARTAHPLAPWEGLLRGPALGGGEPLPGSEADGGLDATRKLGVYTEVRRPEAAQTL